MRALSVIFGTLLAVVCLLIIDLFLPSKPVFLGYQYRILGHTPYVSYISRLHIPIHPPPLSHKKPEGVFYNPPFRIQNWIVADHPVNMDGEYGPHVDGPATFVGQSLDMKTNEVIQQKTYHIDKQGRRVIPGHNSNRKSNFFFLGCSFTFGSNVEDNQSLPAQFEYAQKRYSVYNYSFPGWGPNNLDRLIHQKDFAADVPKRKNNKAIYWFIDQHIGRVTLPMSFYHVYSKSYRYFPYYFLDSHHKLQTEGMIFDHRGLLNAIYNFFSTSSLVSYFGVDFPTHRYSDIELMGAIIADMRDTLKKKFNMELIVAIYPTSTASPYLIEELDKHNVRSIDYSNVLSSYYTSRPDWLSDGHPSPTQNAFLAKQLIRDLELDRED